MKIVNKVSRQKNVFSSFKDGYDYFVVKTTIPSRFWPKNVHMAERPKEKLHPTTLLTERPRGQKLIFELLGVVFLGCSSERANIK